MAKLVIRIALVVGLLTGLSVFLAAPLSADAPAPDKQTAKYEIDFMKDMIDHHAMAVMMAEMCMMHATHPELIAACADMVAMQSAEIAMMQAWLLDWYGITYEPDMMMGNMNGHMKKHGAEFEIWFMKRMINHHYGAIREAQRCTEVAYHGELVTMCEDIISMQAMEIAQMKTWLCEWYDICSYRNKP